MKAVVIPNVKKDMLRDVVLDNVEPGSVVSTDELYSYNLPTGDGFKHGVVSHGKKEYAVYNYRSGETFNVNTVEGFWRLFMGQSGRSPPFAGVTGYADTGHS
jgi:transposase